MGIVKEINNFYYHMALYELQVMNGNDYYNGLSYNSLLYINVIEQMKECTVSKMADVLKITKSAVTLKINELVKQGVVVKKQSEKDKRVYYLELSPHITQVLGVYDQVFYKLERELKGKYSQEQLELFGDVLKTISGYEWRNMQDD